MCQIPADAPVSPVGQPVVVYVRPYESTDLESVRDVCFLTGLMGDPIGNQFGDRDTFAHLFCDWYLLNRPETCFVVDDGEGSVVGYVIASADTPDESAHQREVLTRHLIGRRMILRRDTVRFFARAVTDLARDRSALGSPVDPARFPAEMHINLLPRARCDGLGGELVRRLFETLSGMGVPGVQLGTFGENRNAIAFFEAHGFVSVGDPVPNPGFRLEDGSRATVRRFCRELA